MTDPVPQPSLGKTVLTFLESVGAPSEAQMYLRLFRGLERGQFALVAPSAAVLRENAGTLAEQLAFLKQLGLYVSLVIGGFEALGQEELGWLFEALEGEDLSPQRLAVGPGCLAEARGVFYEARLPVFVFEQPDPAQLAELAAEMKPRKVVFLRSEGGLGPHGASHVEISPGHFLLGHESGLAVINLRSDQRRLLEGGFLGELDRGWLALSRQMLEALADGGSPSTTVSIASPLAFLRELFTVRGEGTLVKLGAALEQFDSYDELDRPRLASLLSESFARPIREEFFARPPLRVYVERDYRGVALLEPGSGAAFLSKFAVLPVARGEGLGQDLWWAMSREHPAFYWRSRADNPINGWYTSVCDGLHRGPHWHVYWRGVSSQDVPRLVEDATARPADFGAAG
ncbi:MAG TPA: hypothetical protein VLC09_06330 [Polyangiaceae bacterium]|nr:hypothetical protein [Polyangiaceae bacterium]